MTVAVKRFQRALLPGQPQTGVWSALASQHTAEILAGAGFDPVMLDTGHAPDEAAMALPQLQAVAAEHERPAAAVVRLGWNDPVLIKRFDGPAPPVRAFEPPR